MREEEGALNRNTEYTGKENPADRQELPEQSGRFYAEMLLRQHPWLKEHLTEQELPLAFSYRKPETLTGISLLFIGAVGTVDTLLHFTGLGGILPGVLLLLACAVSGYAGIWFLRFARRSYVLVTSEKVVYRKTDFLGRPGKTVLIPRSRIKRVRLLKSTVMYRGAQGDGVISITMENGKTAALPRLTDGEAVLGAFSCTA